MRERLEALIDRLLNAKDLTEAQEIAVELQWAIYDYIDQFREDALPISGPQ